MTLGDITYSAGKVIAAYSRASVSPYFPAALGLTADSAATAATNR
jgi:hypothetical protein